MLSAQQLKWPWHIALSVPSNLAGIQPCRLFPSRTCPAGRAEHHAPPCLSKAAREPDPSPQQSVVEPLGFAVTSDGKNAGLDQSLALPQSTGALLFSFSWARVTACKFAQAAESLVLRTATYHSEVCKIRQEMPAFFFLFFSPPLTSLTTFSLIIFFYWKFWPFQLPFSLFSYCK